MLCQDLDLLKDPQQKHIFPSLIQVYSDFPSSIVVFHDFLIMILILP